MTIGFYRRINIIPFEKKITEEEEMKFDKRNILNQSALDYLANIALREYLNMNGLKFDNQIENEKLIKKYRQSNNSVVTFLEDEKVIDDIFANKDKVLKTVMYSRYIEWCKEYDYFIKERKSFYNTVLGNKNYIEAHLDGKEYIKNITKKDINKEEQNKTIPIVQKLRMEYKNGPFGGELF